jgi:hypothetical protein
VSLGITGICRECGKAFEKKRLKQVFCTRECKTKNYNRRVEEAINRFSDLVAVSQGKRPGSEEVDPCPFCLRPLPKTVNPIPTGFQPPSTPKDASA